MKNLYLSNSAIQVFKTCKKRFKLKYLDKVHTGAKVSNKYLSFGNSVHSALAQYNCIKNEKYKNLDVLQNLLRKNWIRQGYESIEEEKSFGIKGLKMFENYLSNPLDSSKDNLIVEEMIMKPLDNGIILCGKIDKCYIRDDDVIEVLDYKTSDNISLSENPQQDPQLLMYILLTNEKLGCYPVAISYYYLTQNIKLVHEVQEEDIIAANEYLTDIISQIKNEQIFEASPTSHCKSNCEYFQNCPSAHDIGEIIVKEIEKAKQINSISTVF